jgi:hypothetical protein
MGWSVAEIIECTRYGLLVVYIKDDHRGMQVCRRVRRKKEMLYAEEQYYMKLPKAYNNSAVLLRPGDLVFVSGDKVASILRNGREESFADVINGRLKINERFFSEVAKL